MPSVSGPREKSWGPPDPDERCYGARPTVHTIVTHPGGSHKDDLLAACVLASLHGCPIVRREPTQADLDDPEVAVVDIGGVHDPARSNFDHHHFPREHPPCPIGSDTALDVAIITAPEARDPKLMQKLDAVAGRVLKK